MQLRHTQPSIARAIHHVAIITRMIVKEMRPWSIGQQQARITDIPIRAAHTTIENGLRTSIRFGETSDMLPFDCFYGIRIQMDPWTMCVGKVYSNSRAEKTPPFHLFWLFFLPYMHTMAYPSLIRLSIIMYYPAVATSLSLPAMRTWHFLVFCGYILRTKAIGLGLGLAPHISSCSPPR